MTTTGSNSDPVFSPSGQNLAFDSNRSGNTDIYSVNVDGSAQTRLTTVSALDNQPSWQALLAMAVRRGYPPGRAGAARVFGREESVQRLAKGTL